MKADHLENNLVWTQSTKYGLVLFALVVALGERGFNVILGAVIIYCLFNWQTALPLLFYSGILKHSRLIESMPIDFMLFCFILTILFYLRELSKNPKLCLTSIITTMLMLLLMVTVCISIFTTYAPFEYIKSSGLLILFLYLPLVIMIINAPASINMEKWLRSFISITMILGWAWVGMGFHNQLFNIQIENKDGKGEILWFMTAFGESYVAFSIFSSFTFLVLFQNFFRFHKERFFSILGLLILSYSLLSSPARGITIGIACCLIFFFWNSITKNLNRFAGLFLTFLAIIFLLILYIRFYASEESLRVFSRLTNYSLDGDSFQHRVRFISEALQYWVQSPWFGTGVDSVAFFNGDKGSYAHNLFIEVILEYGLIGSIPFITFFILCFWCAFNLWKLSIIRSEYTLLWVVHVFIILSVYGIFSASLGQMRQVWIIFALVIAISIDRRILIFKSIKQHN